MTTAAQIDEQLQAAYATGNKAEIILLASMMHDAVVAEFVPAAPVRTNAWRNACTEYAQRSAAIENKILARDELATMDY
jgi:hypothetical protein